MKLKHALTIAGSDSSAGAGIQADLKTFMAHGIYGLSVVTAVTAQNTTGVKDSQCISPVIIAGQIETLFSDIRVDAIKIGMLSSRRIVSAVADALEPLSHGAIVLDTVMVSKNGYPLLAPDAVDEMIRRLFPMARVVTPNIPEAEFITGITIRDIADMETAARMIHGMGPETVLVKGGHLPAEPTDILFDGSGFTHLEGNRIPTKNTHGTGCTLSSAIAANLANQNGVAKAVAMAKAYLTICMENALDIGAGPGPLHHLFSLYATAGDGLPFPELPKFSID